MSPTTRSYLISFTVGTLLTALAIASEQLSKPLSEFQWQPFFWTLGGGVVLFARDYLRNNLGGFLEGVAPAQVKSAVAQEGAKVLVPPAAVPPPKPLDTIENPPTPPV